MNCIIQAHHRGLVHDLNVNRISPNIKGLKSNDIK